MITMYGIPSCDTISKAKKWLTNNNIEFEFHNYKKSGVPEKELKNWVKQLGWEVLLNKRGTTWRKLDDSVKESVDTKSAIQIMLDNPSIIKRPVLNIDNSYTVGFSDDAYKKLFAG